MGMESVYKLSVILNLVDNLSGQMGGVGDNVSGVVNRLNSAFGTMQKAGAAMAGIGAGITGLCMKTVTSTFDTQNALGELSSLGVKDLKAVEDAAKSFSDTWAGTSKADFITASYDIKSGIASLTDEGVAEFTKPLFAIPTHQFLFNAGAIDKRLYMDSLQLETSEYELIRQAVKGLCLYKCGNERYLLEVHAPDYKASLFGDAGGK